MPHTEDWRCPCPNWSRREYRNLSQDPTFDPGIFNHLLPRRFYDSIRKCASAERFASGNSGRFTRMSYSIARWVCHYEPRLCEPMSHHMPCTAAAVTTAPHGVPDAKRSAIEMKLRCID
jgi:hypothetical protein